ncbi:MAG: 1-deoxy-D-xylulose-5-phosphate synthase [Planctomycetota bacterium]|nr:1-deoxy-D-xylulose-5-phosphate synthase [Planctomycetota bacterium]
MESKIMFIQQVSWCVDCYGEHYECPARIGRVRFSKTGRTVYYGTLTLKKTKGYKCNHYDEATSEDYWISGCHKNGNDPLYPTMIHVDADVQEEYWTEIRKKPERVGDLSFKDKGKYQKGQKGRDRDFHYGRSACRA